MKLNSGKGPNQGIRRTANFQLNGACCHPSERSLSSCTVPPLPHRRKSGSRSSDPSPWFEERIEKYGAITLLEFAYACRAENISCLYLSEDGGKGGCQIAP